MQFLKVINYLLLKGHGHPDVKSVIHGDYEQVMQLENGTIEYPFYWVETPDISFSGDNDHLRENFVCGIIIACNVPPENRERRKYVEDLMHTYILQVLTKLREDQHEGKIQDLDISQTKIEAIEINADNSVGWRAEIPILCTVSPDENPIQDIVYPSFIYDSATKTIVENENATLDGYERYYKVWYDGEEQPGEQTETLDVNVPYNTAYVELIYSKKSHKLIASLYIEDFDQDGQSVAYSNNIFI